MAVGGDSVVINVGFQVNQITAFDFATEFFTNINFLMQARSVLVL